MKVFCEYEMVVVNMGSEQMLEFYDDAGLAGAGLRDEGYREFSVTEVFRDFQRGFFLVVIHEFSSFECEQLILLRVGCADICALMRAA